MSSFDWHPFWRHILHGGVGNVKGNCGQWLAEMAIMDGETSLVRFGLRGLGHKNLPGHLPNEWFLAYNNNLMQEKRMVIVNQEYFGRPHHGVGHLEDAAPIAGNDKTVGMLWTHRTRCPYTSVTLRFWLFNS